jgi:hypothetical protein
MSADEWRQIILLGMMAIRERAANAGAQEDPFADDDQKSVWLDQRHCLVCYASGTSQTRELKGVFGMYWIFCDTSVIVGGYFVNVCMYVCMYACIYVCMQHILPEVKRENNRMIKTKNTHAHMQRHTNTGM